VAEARPRILILGLPYFGSMLSGVLAQRGWEARFLAHPGRSPRAWLDVLAAVARADVLYLVSARAERGSPLDRLLRWWRLPAVVHWVGTDVLIAREAYRKGDLSEVVAGNAVHWADAPWLVDELREMGIRSDVVPLPVPGIASGAPPLPASFRVLFYLPVDAFDREVFDIETMLRLPRELPDVAFVLIPSPAESLPSPLPLNLEARGWVTDMDALYRETTVLARLVAHDGMPFMVLEALSRGRHAVYSYELPGVVHARGYDAVKEAITRLRDAHTGGDLGLNEAGMRWVAESHAPGPAADAIDRRLREVLTRYASRG